MRCYPVRYLKVTLLIGSFVVLLVGLLYTVRFFEPAEAALANVTLQNYRTFPGVQFTLFILLAYGIAWTTIDIPRNSLKAVVAAGALLQVMSMVPVLKLLSIFFSPFPSLMAIVCSFAAGLVYSRSEAGSRKRIMRQILGERVSTKTFYALLNSSSPLNLDGERRDISILVCEIFNHDDLEASLTAPDYVALTNSFRRNAADFLVDRGGYLDECDGESLRVVFGAPLADPDHARNACEAALALTERLDEVNAECHGVWKQMFDFRIGVNSGEMVIAAYGSNRLGTFSVAGEPVEFARRLCRANLIYGSRILLGTNTFQTAESSIEVRPMELIQRYDDGSREEIYELLALRDVLSFEDLERRDLFWQGVIYYREQLWDDALGLFHSARSASGSDGPVEFYIRRIEQLRAGTPALDWTSARL
ncbi:MAG TPA: adenylate/guanylate cyclase domain-containing protein [Chthoniobacter sp.]|jgi:adenylate cyclase